MNATCSRSGTLAAFCLLLLQAQVASAQVEEEESAAPSGPPRYAAIGELYQQLCSACHGENLDGTPLGVSLVEQELLHGSSIAAITKSIAEGNIEKEMPAWSEVLQDDQVQSLAIFVAEQRAGYSYDHYSIASSLEIPQGLQESEHHNFQLDIVIDELDPLPYSIAPMPDGNILLTEKKIGLSIVSATGLQSAVISGTPPPYTARDAQVNPQGLERGIGWLQDVALHPDYESNGWIYLYHGDHCESCNDVSRENGRPVSMARLVRGRISDGQWVDEESIWSTGVENYTATTDILLGGRIAFDADGHVFFSIGAKAGFYEPGIQDIGKPWGKIHRVMHDGRIPRENPFVGVSGAVKSIWTIGHRTPQGLEYDAETNSLWGSEHGPRGGDEVNLLTAGSNYGWPFVSQGVHYDGTAVEDMIDFEFDVVEIEQPVVDMTPSPAISSFVVYHGDMFPHWEGNLIVGSLKAQTLFRLEIVDNKLVETETLIRGIGRIRDIELDADGTLLLLIENAAGGKILRLRPEI